MITIITKIKSINKIDQYSNKKEIVLATQIGIFYNPLFP